MCGRDRWRWAGLIPGGGHFLLKRHGRAVLLLVSITLMYLCGLMMRGAMFQPQSGDLLTILINTGGFIGDLASGVLYLLTVWLGYNQPDVAGRVHDYGTKFLVTAGLLNILAMVDAFEIARGEEKLMPKMALSHFEASLLFALFTSVVMGVVTKRDDRERIRYGLYVFGCFVAALVGIGWVMHFGHG